ncbi:MAG: glycosyltransferase family 2 protein [Promethearchaeia archaeon]
MLDQKQKKSWTLQVEDKLEDIAQTEVEVSKCEEPDLGKRVVICIPAYNEEKDLGNVLQEISNVMRKTNYDFRILVLNDGSDDNTEHIALRHGVDVVSNHINLGLAHTFRREMELCQELGAEIIVHTDADGQYPAIYIPYMIREVIEGADLVLGSRFGKGVYAGSFLRKIGNLFFAKVFSVLLRKNIHDTTTGFRAFNQKVCRMPINNGFTYTQEQLIKALKGDKTIREVPIEARETRESKLFGNILEYFVRALKNIYRILF